MQRHPISEVSQWRTGRSSQSLPTRRQPGDGVTWMCKGTLGSTAVAGDAPGATIQALLIARPRLSRALWTSWSKMVVAFVSESQLTAFAPLGGHGFRAEAFQPAGISPIAFDAADTARRSGRSRRPVDGSDRIHPNRLILPCSGPSCARHG